MKEKQIKKLIAKNGRQVEVFVCMEELGELIQAISKCERGRLGDRFSAGDIDHLCEEIADAQNTIKYLKCLYNLDPNRIRAWQRAKQERTIKRYKL